MGGVNPGSDDGDVAVPGVHPGTERGPDEGLCTVEVDGEVFAIRPSESSGTDYTWLSGPNEGYGFGVSPAPRSLEEHRRHIRGFLAQVDPATGYIEDG